VSITSTHGHLAARLGRTTVLVVGDLMLDCYYWGDVRRISPEAPVPVVKVNEKTYRLGGAGNVAANLSGLGCSATVIGLIGQDAASGQLQELLASLNIKDHCLIDANRPTITKTRIMASKQQVVRLDEEDGTIWIPACRNGSLKMWRPCFLLPMPSSYRTTVKACSILRRLFRPLSDPAGK
jgi:rfaE bifunctional protein kinase chain/domain